MGYINVATIITVVVALLVYGWLNSFLPSVFKPV